MIPAIGVPSASNVSIVTNSGSLHPIRRMLTTIAGSQDEEECEEEEDDDDDEEEEEEEEEESDGGEYEEDISDKKLNQRNSLKAFIPTSSALLRYRNHYSHHTRPEQAELHVPKLIEKSVIIHKDENGFGLRIGGQCPVFVEHVHENSAAWRAGVRCTDRISKVNGAPIYGLNHTEVVLMFKNSTRFVGLTLLTAASELKQDVAKEIENEYYNPATGHTIQKNNNLSPFDRLSTSLANYGCNIRNTRLPHTNHIRSVSRSFNLHTQDTPSAQYEAARHAASHELNLKYQPARRSESVMDTRYGYMTANRYATVSSHTSNCSDSSSSSHIWQQQNESSSSSTCVNCLATKERLMKASDTEHPSFTYLQSQLNQLSKETDLKSASQYYQRPAYGSLRDSKQQFQRQQHVEIKVSSQESRQVEERVESASSYMKLSRSINNISSTTAFSPRQPAVSTKSIVESNTGVKVTESADKAAIHQAPPVTVQRPPVTNKRLEIIKEFIDTEKTHTERLRCMDELFYRPLKQGGYMTAEQLRAVFSCHKTLYKIHRQIHRTLLSASYNLCAEPMIGSALLEIFEGDLKRRLERAACTFCAAQSTNVELLNKLTKRDTKVGDFIAQVSSQQMVGRLGVKDLLASCFQRLTKYPLLLENLLKATPRDIPVLTDAGGRGGRGGGEKNGETKREVGGEKTKREDEREEMIKVDNVVVAATGSIQQEASERVAATAVETTTSQRMLAIGLAEEREFIERALHQSRQILFKVNESVKVATSNCKLKEIWKKTDKYPGVPLVDISKQHVVHEGQLTLRLSKRSFDVYVLLLTDYLIILSREGQDKYRLKFFTPDGKSSSSSSGNTQTLTYSPVFIVDEHLSTRDAATDENGFYLLCKRKDDSRIYEFASRSPTDRIKWRDRIQSTIERQINRTSRRPSCESTTTKSSSEISAKQDTDESSAPSITPLATSSQQAPYPATGCNINQSMSESSVDNKSGDDNQLAKEGELTKIEGTISYVEDDGIVLPSKLESSQVFADQAVQVTLVDSPLH